MINTAHQTFLFDGSAALIISDQAGQCACGGMTHMFVNRRGKTLCLACDDKRHLEFTPPDPGDEPSVEQSFTKAIV